MEEAKTFHLLKDRRAELRSPRTRSRKASASLEVIIAVGGEDDKVVLRSVESFDPYTHHWRTLACLPFAVSKHGLVVTGRVLLIIFISCISAVMHNYVHNITKGDEHDDSKIENEFSGT